MTLSRVADAHARVLTRLGTATVYEASRLPCALPNTIQAIWSGASVVGRALPVRTNPGDNLPLHLALATASPGDVMVVEGHGAPHGYWGEVMTVAAMARGVAGLVINGCVRDVDAIAGLGFPVFATGRSIVGTVKATTGTVGDPINVGGTVVAAGDVIVADADGVVAIPNGSLDAVLAAAVARADAEDGYMRRLRAGETTLDIYGLGADGGDAGRT